MNLSTPVTPPTPPFRLLPETPVLLLGSCFSDEMAARMYHSGLSILANPFGTLYNPASIALLLSKALENSSITEKQLVFHDGLWHSWLHHSSFSSPDPDTCLSLCNEAISRTHSFLNISSSISDSYPSQHPLLIITFGTSYVFSLAHSSLIVANCHKLPPSNFIRRRLSIDEITSIWNPLLRQLSNKGIHVVFSVSPIRHLAEGAHDNQLSKSTLLLAIDQLLNNNLDNYYFPSYEILLDELRDYRFYNRDLTHPSDLAVDILWERFSQTFFSPAHQQLLINNFKHYRQTLHKSITSSVNSKIS